MSLFAGVSFINKGNLGTTLPVDVRTDSGYHLLVVNNYKRTVQETPNEDEIYFDTFMVGGNRWFIEYSPNGCGPSCADFICLNLSIQEKKGTYPSEVKYQFSFVDQVEYQNPIHICATESYNFSKGNPSNRRHKFMKRDALERSTHLKNDCITIRCDIMVCKGPNTSDAASGTMSDIGQNLDYLLQNKVGADVTFEVNGKTFTVHRCVLAARSTVFMAQLFGPMKEGTTSSVIQIEDMEAKLFRALLSFIYTGSFPKMDKDSNMEVDKAEVVDGQEERAVEYIMWLQDLFVAADRYDLQRLKLLCEENMSEHMCANSVASTLALAEQHHCHSLREACLKFIQVQSPKCLRKVMATDAWTEITTTYPSFLNDLIAKLASNQKDR